VLTGAGEAWKSKFERSLRFATGARVADSWFIKAIEEGRRATSRSSFGAEPLNNAGFLKSLKAFLAVGSAAPALGVLVYD